MYIWHVTAKTGKLGCLKGVNSMYMVASSNTVSCRTTNDKGLVDSKHDSPQGKKKHVINDKSEHFQWNKKHITSLFDCFRYCVKNVS
jgi:catabolite regulation protein CreA